MKCIRAAHIRFDGVHRLHVFIRGVEFLKIIYVYLQKSIYIFKEEIRTLCAKWQRSPVVYLHKNTLLKQECIGHLRQGKYGRLEKIIVSRVLQKFWGKKLFE